MYIFVVRDFTQCTYLVLAVIKIYCNDRFACMKDEENLDDESKEILIYIVFSNMIIYSRYDLNYL